MISQPRIQGKFGSVPIEERFWAKVDKTPGCWLWLGTKDEWGYGRFWDGTRPGLAHRFSYTLAGGVIPPKYVIDHLCRTASCVNPKHLDAVPHRENISRGKSKALKHLRKPWPAFRLRDEFGRFIKLREEK